jgi:hypothetical protein
MPKEKNMRSGKKLDGLRRDRFERNRERSGRALRRENEDRISRESMKGWSRNVNSFDDMHDDIRGEG